MTEEIWLAGLPQRAVTLPTPCLNPDKPLMASRNVGIGIAEASKRPDDAWRFLSFAVGPEGAQALARTGEMPAYMSDAVEAAWFEQKPAPPQMTRLFFHARWIIVPAGVETHTAGWKVLQLFTWALKDGRPIDEAYAEYLKLR